jgi:hypothetical protein
MKIGIKTCVLAGALALAASPAWALPPQVPDNDGTQHAASKAPAGETGTPGPSAGLPEKAKAYGVYCRGFSRKHVAGSTGTPFSKCVTAMAKLATDQSSSPRKACAGQSKRHVHGQKGTPFSRCVTAGARLLGKHEGTRP